VTDPTAPPVVGRAAELAAIVRFTLPKPQGLDGKMCECVECRDKARAFAALSELAALAASPNEDA
jgi:hypothetical protein